MRYRFAATFLIAAALAPQPSLEGQARKPAVYREAVLEDFEATVYTDAHISCTKPGGRAAGLTIRDRLPATGDSKNYLEARMHTGGDDVFVITPAKELFIEGHCTRIGLHAFGIKTAGILSLLIEDTGGRRHLLRAGTINFSGWRRIEIPLGPAVTQADDFLGQGKTMKILQIQYHTAGPEVSARRWEYLYLDDITATVRDRYLDRRSDEW